METMMAKVKLNIQVPYGIIYFKVRVINHQLLENGTTQVLLLPVYSVRLKYGKYVLTYGSFKQVLDFINDLGYEIMVISTDMRDMYRTKDEMMELVNKLIVK